MKLTDYHNVYFVGIGGIGMSALARWFKSRGTTVAGYDRVQTPLCQQLESEGIRINYDDSLEALPDWAKVSTETLVVFTPAVPNTHRQLKFFREASFEILKRSQVLGLITKDHYTIAVAGTHGKTTTSSMIAHLLNDTEVGCSAFVGGIMSNYGTNLLIGNADQPVVVEADEFDRSFMRLHPNFSIVTSLDPDHLDIYGDPEEIENTYLDFIKLNTTGEILLNENVAKQAGSKLDLAFDTYGQADADARAKNIRVKDGKFVFDYQGKESIEGIKLRLPGFHNVQNAVAAMTAALASGLDKDQVQTRMESYTGVKRRFEYHIDNPDLVYIDDYAHHPSEIKALLLSVKELYPDREITVIFQPHLFTRTRDFQDDFAKSLSLADKIILLDIYPAREEPIPGITADVIREKMDHSEVVVVSKEEAMDVLKGRNLDVLLTVGAGDIDTLVPIISNHYQNNHHVEA